MDWYFFWLAQCIERQHIKRRLWFRSRSRLNYSLSILKLTYSRTMSENYIFIFHLPTILRGPVQAARPLATGGKIRVRSRVSEGWSIFPLLRFPDWSCGSLSLLYNDYQGHYQRGPWLCICECMYVCRLCIFEVFGCVNIRSLAPILNDNGW